MPAHLRSVLHRRLLAWTKSYSRRGIYELVRDVAARVRPSDVVLNVGAGGAIEQALQADLNAVVPEAELVTVDIAAAREPSVVSDVATLSFADESVDHVVALEILEHVSDPQAALDEIRRILKPAGSLVLSTPFALPIHDEPHDYYRFTRYGLGYLLRAYVDVAVEARNGYFESIGVLVLRSIMEPGIRTTALVAGVLISGAMHILRWLDRWTPSDRLTTGYTVLAAKGGDAGLARSS